MKKEFANMEEVVKFLNQNYEEENEYNLKSITINGLKPLPANKDYIDVQYGRDKVVLIYVGQEGSIEFIIENEDGYFCNYVVNKKIIADCALEYVKYLRHPDKTPMDLETYILLQCDLEEYYNYMVLRRVSEWDAL